MFASCGDTAHFTSLKAHTRLAWAKFHAQKYYAGERIRVLSSASEHSLHPYFWPWPFEPFEGGQRMPTRPALVKHRLVSMVRHLRTENRQDYRIEKDKCVMYRWFLAHRLPTAHVHGIWYDLDAVLHNVRAIATRAASMSGTDGNATVQWPLFLKACVRAVRTYSYDTCSCVCNAAQCCNNDNGEQHQRK